MVSSNEVSFNLRGNSPLSQDLARWDSQWWEVQVQLTSHTKAAPGSIVAKEDGMDEPDLPHAH
jgi:hypothetical protein